MLQVSGSRKTSRLESLVRWWERNRADLRIEFPDGEIASKPINFYVPIQGRVLRVPPLRSAVLRHPSGRIQVWGSGDHYLDLPSGLYTVQLVDLQQQNNYLPPVVASSQDAWRVCLKQEIVWRVVQPAVVIAKRNFKQTLVSTCMAAIADFIRATPHDALVQVPGETQTISEAEINQAILTNLRQRRIFEGLEILDLILRDRQGDQRLTEAIQNATVESKAINLEMLLQEQKTQLAAQKINQELDLAKQQRAVEIANAETERLIVEEIEQRRLRIAQIEEEEAGLRRSVLMQQIELQQWANEQLQEFQREMKVLDVKGEVFKQFAQAFANSALIPGMLTGAVGGDQSELLRGIIAMIGSLNQEERLLTTGNGHADIYTRLRQEMLTACARLPDLSYLALEILPAGNLRAKFLYHSHQISIECEKDYPAQAPKAFFQNGIAARRAINFQWKPGMEIADVLLAALKKVKSAETQDQPAQGNGGTDWPHATPG